MKNLTNILLTCFLIVAFINANAQKLDNPITADYLKKNISKSSPKLILTPPIEQEIKGKLKSDPLVKKYYQYLKNEAELIQKLPLLKHELEGFRLLAVSREMLRRMTTLCMVYRMGKDPAILKRIDTEINTVCNFPDWNTQHFLDVAEMSFAVALAVDWTGQWLPKATVKLAKNSLIEKGIIPSYNEAGERMFWISSSNNWNAVCHGGMIAASIATADVNPELAAKTIARALDKLPNSLAEYAPNGIYPEGPTYWGYGTSYAVIAANSLTTAFGSDFGISASPGFLESIVFLNQVTAPSGKFFNFADSGDELDSEDLVLSTWFAAKTGDGLFFNSSYYENPSNAGRLAGLGLIWLSQYSQKKVSTLATNWHGKGRNPVAVFRGDGANEMQLFLAVKGGKAHLSHGNMDAGTFVFDLDGIRWVLDPGNQSYYPLNKIGFNLAGHCQDCPRWTLLTKKNQGHSTITVNDERFLVDAQARIIDFRDGPQPEVTIDMTEIYGNNLKSMTRRFIRDSNQSFIVEDNIQLIDSTRTITWGLMTTADVQPVHGGAILKKDGKQLKLTIESPHDIAVSVISLDPPPMHLDKTIENLKRIEIRVPAYVFEDRRGTIRVRLSGE